MLVLLKNIFLEKRRLAALTLTGCFLFCYSSFCSLFLFGNFVKKITSVCFSEVIRRARLLQNYLLFVLTTYALKLGLRYRVFLKTLAFEPGLLLLVFVTTLFSEPGLL